VTGGGPVFQPLPALEGRSLVQRVERELLRAIVEGRIELGERIVEAEYARQLGISRAPLREAARLLEQRGLLIARPNRGFFVRRYTAGELDDLYGLRICLERYAVTEATSRASVAELGGLASQLARMTDAAVRGDRFAIVEEDIGFHRLLCDMSGNTRLRRTFEDLAVDLAILISRLADLDVDPRIVVESHTEFLTAILARDGVRATEAIDDHIRGAWTEMRQSAGILSTVPA
jgi:DNA-binding GntR family transcriptional regulator